MNGTNGRKRIVILGGGCGGVVAATMLGRKLGGKHDVILVDRRAEHIFMPAFLFLMVGQRQPRDISRRLDLPAGPSGKAQRQIRPGRDPGDRSRAPGGKARGRLASL
ncbi:MAG: tryptophan 7-halogenase [Deltaproteobacteria bacterium]|nr:tryptophan 7-halogenase [Deltaproteobacteria bacterium]